MNPDQPAHSQDPTAVAHNFDHQEVTALLASPDLKMSKEEQSTATLAIEESPSSPFEGSEDIVDIDSSADSEKSKPMISRAARLCVTIGCGTCIVIVGIVCLVLGVQGFFTFHDPCVGVHSMTIKDMDLGSNGDATNSGGLLGFFDTITGGAASQLIPTQATLTLEMIMEVNNTNPYDLEYEQNEEGTISIPATSMGSSSVRDQALSLFPPESDEDLVIGTWQVPDATLKKKARNQIPVSITTTIDLMSGDTLDLGGTLVSGGALLFRIKGGIEGSSWVPGLAGQANFLCLARLDNILNFGEDAQVVCRHSTRVGKLLNGEGEIDFQMEEEVDPTCFV